MRHTGPCQERRIAPVRHGPAPASVLYTGAFPVKSLKSEARAAEKIQPLRWLRTQPLTLFEWGAWRLEREWSRPTEDFAERLVRHVDLQVAMLGHPAEGLHLEAPKIVCTGRFDADRATVRKQAVN